MSARVLVIDQIAVNRIWLTALLNRAKYSAVGFENFDQARQEIAGVNPPQAIILDASGNPDQVQKISRFLDQTSTKCRPSLIVILEDRSDDQRADILNSGATDVHTKPVDLPLLTARLRSLLRSSDARTELRLRDDTHRALGLAESAQAFEKQPQILYLTEDLVEAKGRKELFKQDAKCSVVIANAKNGIHEDMLKPAPDLVLLDVARQSPHCQTNEFFQFIAEINSRTVTRHAAQIVVLPKGQEGSAALALDLGAHDVVPADVGPKELSARLKIQLARKFEQDRLRQTVQTGLQAAITDPLTGLYNRRYAIPYLERMAERAIVTNRPFAAMIADIDHFKSVNDTYGHHVGDEVLRQVARRLMDNLRSVDLVARMGGEEFLIAMPETEPTQAQGAAERLKNVISGQPFICDLAEHLNITVSIGVALSSNCLPFDLGKTFDLNDLQVNRQIEGLIEQADGALYKAKSAGRNTVQLVA